MKAERTRRYWWHDEPPPDTDGVTPKVSDPPPVPSVPVNTARASTLAFLSALRAELHATASGTHQS